MVYLVGNWKDNATLTQTKIWLTDFQDLLPNQSSSLETVICLPFTNIAEVNRIIKAANLPLKTGAQDVDLHLSTSQTGGITAKILSELVSYCLVGHSERRQATGETCQTVARKVNSLLEFGITPIICLDTPYLDEQIKAIYQLNLPINRCLIAYEPLAAIGSGQPAEPNLIESAAAQIAFLTDSNCPILYGGSVTEKNIALFVNLPNISGVLVGSASLNPQQFTSLISQIS